MNESVRVLKAASVFPFDSQTYGYWSIYYGLDEEMLSYWKYEALDYVL
jgi:hypothetical protein